LSCVLGSASKSMPLECPDMSGTAGEEHANLYMRGVNEAASGMELDAQEVLDVMDAFGEDGVRCHLMGILEGIEGHAEQEIGEYEMLEASIAYVVHEFSASILEESEDMLQVWVERAPKDLGTGIDLHIVDDEEEILNGGRIIAVELKDATDRDAGQDREAIRGDTGASETAPAVVTVEKWKYEIVEYSDPADWPKD
jgi:hypothetical protein